MLPKKARVKKALFPDLVRKGAFCSTPNFSLRFLSPSQPDGTVPVKIAIVVSKKVAKSAVARNRSRRRVSGAVEDLLRNAPLASQGIKPSFLAAIFINRSIAELSRAELADEIAFLLKKAKLV